MLQAGNAKFSLLWSLLSRIVSVETSKMRKEMWGKAAINGVGFDGIFIAISLI